MDATAALTVSGSGVGTETGTVNRRGDDVAVQTIRHLPHGSQLPIDIRPAVTSGIYRAATRWWTMTFGVALWNRR
jgi:hypothetical protein